MGDPVVDERALVAGLRRGERAALRQVYGQYAARLFRYLVRLAGRPDVAEDLHQETWMAVARAAARLSADTDLPAWLFTIARNKHRSHRRWQQADRVRFASGGAPAVEAVAVAADPEARRDLERALGALPEIHREVLLLVGCEGLGHDQAAAVLGISPEATRQRLSRARAALAALLSDAGGEGSSDKVIDMRKGTR